MKKFFVFFGVVLICNIVFAETINVNWKVGDTTYTTSTCESGGNLIIPQTPPTKYGYTFVGWNYEIIGKWSQSGTPTPNNPTEPVFYQLGNTVLRALGSGENFIADEYNPSTEKITRYVGVKVLDGTEAWGYSGGSDDGFYLQRPADVMANSIPMCTHFKGVSYFGGDFQVRIGNAWGPMFRYTAMGTNVANWTQWLADQYANGTPVTVYYPLAEPVEESWSLSE